MRVTTGAREAWKATKATSDKTEKTIKKEAANTRIKATNPKRKATTHLLGKNGQSIKREKSQLEREASSIILLILL
jgi:hypothetical protein